MRRVSRGLAPGLRRGTACRCCRQSGTALLADLGMVPAELRAIPPEGLDATETFRPLRPRFCGECFLVQLSGPASMPAGRGEDAAFADAAWAEALVARFELDATTEVAEIACRAPTPAFARRAMPVVSLPLSLGRVLARRLRAAGHAPVLVMAHDAPARVPDLHDMLAGLRMLLAPGGVLALDLPHALPLLREARFDALRHDRLSWFTLAAAEIALMQHGLVVLEADATPCGSLRLLARHVEDRGKPLPRGLDEVRRQEEASGLHRADAYLTFAEAAVETTCALLDFLLGMRHAGRSVAGLVEAGHGDILLAHAGIGPALLPFVVDADPRRQGGAMPGTRIPIRAPEAILRERPDFLLLLAGDRAAARRGGLDAIRCWGGRFALPGRVIELF